MGMGVGAVVLGSSILGAVGGMLVRLVYRFGFLQRFDKVAGIPLGAATAAVTLYVALVGTIALDGWLSPLHGTGTIGPQQLAAVEKLAAINPTFAAFADPTMLNTIAAAAVKAKTTDLQIRGIPVKLRDELRRKAESKGVSMSQYLIELIQRDVPKMPLDEWIAMVRKNPRIDIGMSAAELLREVDDEDDARWDAYFGFDTPAKP